VKIDTQDSHAMSFSICEFLDDRCGKGHTLLGVTFCQHFLHFSSDLDTIWYKGYPQKRTGRSFRENRSRETHTLLVETKEFQSVLSTIIVRFLRNSA